MGSDTAVLPAIHDMPTTVEPQRGCSEALFRLRGGSGRKTSSPTDAFDWAATSSLVTGISAGQGPIVGLAGLEPAASSLSGFCPRACFRRIEPATCANDLRLETAGDRCEPLGSDGVWTKRGPGRRFDPVTAQSVVDLTTCLLRCSAEPGLETAWRLRACGFDLALICTNRTRDRRGPPARQAQAHPRRSGSWRCSVSRAG